jgi:hypothetical protein
MVASRSFLKGKKGAVVAPFFFWFFCYLLCQLDYFSRCCIHMLALADLSPWPFQVLWRVLVDLLCWFLIYFFIYLTGSIMGGSGFLPPILISPQIKRCPMVKGIS